ncbi:MAG: membrane or secreted protein [Flammeovirgaceae bacterium]|nr:membrane or secreted protein [Flammeovirgaceae bacterium]
MKKLSFKLPALITINLLIISGFTISNKNIKIDIHPHFGAWDLVSYSTDGTDAFKDAKVVKIFSNGHFAITAYRQDSKEFVGTMGGTYLVEGETVKETIEFSTWNAEEVGNTYSFSMKMKGKTMTLNSNDSKAVFTWKRIDKGVNQGATLAGAWRIRERERNGEMSAMKRGPRKTIKILSATRFQWTAFNNETKQFMGTGGGTYSAKDGIYTETIEFFSRDSSRVGMSLSFDFERKGNDWHHKGKSSKGKPIYEIWGLED